MTLEELQADLDSLTAADLTVDDVARLSKKWERARHTIDKSLWLKMENCLDSFLEPFGFARLGVELRLSGGYVYAHSFFSRRAVAIPSSDIDAFAADCVGWEGDNVVDQLFVVVTHHQDWQDWLRLYEIEHEEAGGDSDMDTY